MKNEYGAECYIKLTDNWIFEPVASSLGMPFYGRVSLGNGTELAIGCFFITKGRQAGRLFLGIENVGGCYTFSANTFPSYVEEKIGIGGSDAEALADFINGQFGNPNRLYFGNPQELYI